jgi:hypothetical protein
MPVTVKRHMHGKTPSWHIVEISTGKVKGHSTSKKKASISASFINSAVKRKGRKKK